MLEPDTILNGRYKIVEQIGIGGMATVYRATDMRLGRTVAVKILSREFARDDPFVQRFQQEAEFAASLGQHPNIVAIYDIGEDADLHYIVMELIGGVTLKQMIRDRAPLPVSEAFGIGAQVASALTFAHARGLVHRDVKPQNIMVTPEGTAKVTDFGIARSGGVSQLTRTGTVLGTVHYFSPEQAQGDPAAPASDIYSLGIILYEMLTGHLPFDADNAIGIAMQHLHSEPPPPQDYNPSLPPQAVATVMRALAKDPAQRYRDAAEFAAALSAPIGDFAGTTTINPVYAPVSEATAQLRPVPAVVGGQAPPPRPPIVTTTAVEDEGSGPNSLRMLALLLLGLVAIVVIAAAVFFVSGNLLGGGPGKATPTPTATPKPKKKPTATATVAVTVAPTVIPPTLPPPTNTAVPPTRTPVPKPTSTPTATVPAPIDTPTLIVSPIATITSISVPGQPGQ